MLAVCQGAVSRFEYVVVVRFCTFPLSVSVVTVVVVWLGDNGGPGCVTARSWTVPLSYISLRVPISFSPASVGEGRVAMVSSVVLPALIEMSLVGLLLRSTQPRPFHAWCEVDRRMQVFSTLLPHLLPRACLRPHHAGPPAPGR